MGIYIGCDCHDVGHFIHVSEAWDSDEDEVTFLNVRMGRGRFWWRVKNAFAYLFGRREYLNLGEVVLDKEGREALVRALTQVDR